MDIGFDIRTPDVVTDAERLTELVTAGEDLGYDYTTLSDHLVVTGATSKYAHAGSAPAVHGRCHEQLTTIAFLAAKTQRLRFVTSVMVVPYRPAVLAAKMLSTIDVLSGGRLTVGVGTGWVEPEFRALAAPDHAERGRVTDEYVEAMSALWTEPAPSYSGRFVEFSGISVDPPPVQSPRPPIWVGGMSNPARRRAARLGDAWYPMLNDAVRPLDSVGLLRAGIADIRARTEAAGRDPDAVGVAVRVAMYGGGVDPRASDGERRLFSGSDAECAADLATLRDLGIVALDLRFGQHTADEALRAMEAFQRDIVAKV
jgi:probable F420-dependent oxidoreductase